MDFLPLFPETIEFALPITGVFSIGQDSDFGSVSWPIPLF